MKNGKNILMIAYTDYYTDPRVIKEAEAAREAGFNVDFISLRKQGEGAIERDGKLTIYRVKQERYRGADNIKYLFSYLMFVVRVFFKVSLLSVKKRYVVAHVNNMPDFVIFSVVLLKFFGTRLILDIHDPMPRLFITKMQKGKNSIIYKIILWQELLSAALADIVITVSNPVKEALVHDGITEEKIKVIVNFADENIFRFESEYRLSEKIRLIYHGTIAERYGLDKILHALSKVENPDKFQFKIIGRGDYSCNIRSLIVELGLSNIVEFDNQFYPFKELPQIIGDYNLGIVPLELTEATDYALSTKMFEYLITGMPILTIKNKAVKHYFTEDIGFFYDPNDSSTIVRILDNIGRSSDILIKKRNEIKLNYEKFTWGREKTKYQKILHEQI